MGRGEKQRQEAGLEQRQRQEGYQGHSSWEEREKLGHGVREGEKGALKVLLRGAPLKPSRTTPFGASVLPPGLCL